MSKELAQAVGGKKIGLLFVLLAALAVFATVGSQWRGANATVTQASYVLSGPWTGTDCTGAAPASVATGTTLYYCVAGGPDATVLAPLQVNVTFPGALQVTSATQINGSGPQPSCSTSTNSASCTYSSATATSTFQLRITTTTVAGSAVVAGGGATAPVAGAVNAGVDDPSNGSANATNNTAALTVATASGSLTKTPATSNVAIGGGTAIQTITWTNTSNQATTALTITDEIPAGTTATTIAPSSGACLPAAPVVGPATITCTGFAAVAAAGNASVVITNTVAAQGVFTTLTDTANASATFAIGSSSAGPVTAQILVGAPPFANVELRHVNEAGAIVSPQDVFNNVRGAVHNACLFTDPLGNNAVGALTPFTPAMLGTPLNLTNIQVNAGGGYKVVGDSTPSFTNPIFYTGTAGASTGAQCFSWTSTAAGDQELSVVVTVGGSTSTIDWDTNNDGNHTEVAGSAPTPNNADLIKEWNVLETSSVTGAGTATSGAGTNAVTYATSRQLTLDPSSGNHIFAPVVLTDSFLGSHITRTGGTSFTTSIPLVGVIWNVTLTGCGSLSGATSGVTTLNPDGSVGNQPSVTLNPGSGASDCIPGLTSVVKFTGQEPGALGSGPGVTVTETVTVSYTQAIPVKQVLLAWAGQRVILEHDWRITPGDNPDLSRPGFCPFGQGANIQYTRSAGSPGNFITGLNANLSGNDQANVQLTGDNSQVGDATLRPQDACISRVLYESEDPGEVDVEAFANNGGTVDVSKVAFVVYYMKINTVSVSLVNQVSKPTHNSSVVSDYAPGNPWDASKDAANNTADWNVSRDILVRGRVTGWFVNSNPSGRARDASNPQNVLPADRWVMPDDWVNIAGGSALAGAFRPSYDLMFAPNNTSGLALTTPNGVTAQFISVTVAGSGTGASAASPLRVAGTQGLVVGSVITVGASTTTRTVTALTGTTIVMNPALAAAPAAGTAVFLVSAVPFEGPYSLIDIPGFAANNGGVAGAALSNEGLAVYTRDTTQGDGVIDWWDAPMPPANISVALRGTGFLKQVIKSDVYYIGTANTAPVGLGGTQIYPNPYYLSNIPESPYIPAVAAGGGYLWNSWGSDGPNSVNCVSSSFNPCSGGNGPYTFWTAALVGTNSAGIGDGTLTSANRAELAAIQTAYGDTSIARDLVVFSDNHGEFMVTANGDFKTDLTACATNALAGGKLCKPGDKVGVASISAVADYPDFKKHFPVASNVATVNWTWGGYKNVTVEPGETDQFKYVVFHAMDRDGFCDASSIAAVQLHPVLTSLDTASPVGGNSAIFSHGASGNQIETVDFLIDSGEGIILNANGSTSFGSGTNVNDGRQFATGVQTYDYLARKAAGLQVFPLDASNASATQTDECQAYIKVSNSLLGILNVLTIAHDDEGNIGFDKVIDLTGTTSYTLNFRWSLITWAGADGIPVADALKGGATTKNPGGNDISAQVTAVYGWDQVAQAWLGFFPTGVNVPGANNLTALKTGSAYWIAITGPGPVTWTVTTNVGAS